ncbi:MAG: hypothetical protein F6K26_08460 [Moorea sp. SIO2I5]|nr:hypothetical protein [Moorena sp. SIO2I5]
MVRFASIFVHCSLFPVPCSLFPVPSGIKPDLRSVSGAAVELMAVFHDAYATHSGKLRGGLSYELE